MDEVQWWHLWVGYDAAEDVSAHLLAGPTPIGPDEVGEQGKTAREFTLQLRDFALRYAESWNHEPTQLDIELVIARVSAEISEAQTSP